MKNHFRHIPGIRILKDEPLHKHTSFHIGGAADYFIRIFSLRALKKIMKIITAKRLKYFIIGSGTNLLVADTGFHGVVIKLEGIFKRVKKTNCHFGCGAGVLLDKFLKRASDLGYGGAEFLAGIPGTVGGAVKGNAGAFGRSFADVTEEVTVLGADLKEYELKKSKIGFAYRRSKIKNGTIIMAAKIVLAPQKRRFIVKKIKKNLQHRWQRQPWEYSAGSYFRNPAVVPAGKLIEECGLKGLRVGDAVVSKKHANFIVNLGQARAGDVIRLARMVKKVVKAKKGISLEEEVKLLNS